MKKYIFLSIAALAAVLSGCSKAETAAQATNDEEITITIGAGLGDGTRTVYVPESGKVFWKTGDQMGLKFKKATPEHGNDNDNQQLTLVSGADTQYGVFSGKIGGANDAVPADKNFVVYYPKHSTVSETGSVSDIDDFTLGHKFPKIQNTADVLFEANYMYGIAKDVEGWPGSTAANIPVDIKLKNAMAVIDFTIKGEGKIEKLYLTDLDETAQAMYGLDNIKIVNGEVESVTFSAAKSAAERTIEADFNVPVELTADGSHVYVTVAPRKFAKGIKVCFMLTDGDYMIKTIGEDQGFTVASGKSYTAPAATFASSKTEGKGYAAGCEYTFTTITDARDSEVYRVATLADGKTWMLDNLRYKPETITPSNTLTGGKPEACAGVWYPVVINATGNGVQFGGADDVKKYGYLYNMAVAFGEDIEYIDDMQRELVAGTKLQDAAITEVNGKTTSICPTGWSLPTKAQYNALYTASGSTLTGLEAQGFEMTGFGSITVVNITAAGVLSTTGTFSGYANNKMNTNYMLLANSAVTAKTGTIGIFNFTGAMTNRNNNTAATATLIARSAGAIRCIKNEE